MDGLMAEAAAVGDEDVALDNSIQQSHGLGGIVLARDGDALDHARRDGQMQV